MCLQDWCLVKGWYLARLAELSTPGDQEQVVEVVRMLTVDKGIATSLRKPLRKEEPQGTKKHSPPPSHLSSFSFLMGSAGTRGGCLS